MAVRKNLDYGRNMNALNADPGEEERILDMLNIADLVSLMLGNLSGGEKQRVAIGRALLSRPQLLLLDELLASLDNDRKDEILPYFGRLRDAGIPMVYITHAIDEARQVTDTVIRMSKGRIA
jgi:molybdate transport system ATP-binding protein